MRWVSFGESEPAEGQVIVAVSDEGIVAGEATREAGRWFVFTVARDVYRVYQWCELPAGGEDASDEKAISSEADLMGVYRISNG